MPFDIGRFFRFEKLSTQYFVMHLFYPVGGSNINFYRAFYEFGPAKFTYSGLILRSS